MATSVVAYQPATGRDFVTLTSWTGSALFTATPVAGEQIEGPDTLTYPADSDPTGADGTYTLRHIKLSGEVEAVEFQIGEPAVEPSSASVTVPLAPSAGRSFVTLTSWAGDAVFATTPIAGDQIEHPEALTVGANGVITGNDGSYTVRHIRADGTVEALSYVIGEVEQPPEEPPVEPSSASTTVPLVVPEGLSLATLEEGFSTYNFQQQPVGEPQAGWQLINDAAYGYFDSQGNFWVFPGDLEGEFDLWFIDLDGVVYKETMRTSDLANADGGTDAPGNSQAWIFNKFIKPLAPVAWTWGRRHPKTGMRVRVHK